MKSTSSESIVVVTGGASGIGAACATVLAKRGYKIVVADINEQGETVSRQLGGTFYKIDVTNDEQVHRAANQIEQELGAVQHLINCAGIIQQPLPPQQLSMETWDDIVKVDQRGTYLTSLAFSRAMIKRGYGTITNIASITAHRSVPLHSYAPAKAAVVAMTECLAAEWGPHGIRVNAISPGHTVTPALQHAIDSGERDIDLLTSNALGRMVNAEEIGTAVAFLISDDAAAITGVNLPVDCGWLVATTWNTYGGLRTQSHE